VTNPSPGVFNLFDYVRANPPQAVFNVPEQITECLLNQNPCDPKSPVELRLPDGTHGPFQFHLSFKKNGMSQTFSLNFFDGMPSFDVWGASKLESPVYFSPNNYLLELSKTGEILFARMYPYRASGFRPHLVGGRKLYSYLKHMFGFGSSVGGQEILLDENYNELKTLPWDQIDQHEFLMPDQEHYIFISYRMTTDKLGTCRIEQSVHEYKNGKSIFELSTEELQRDGFLYASVEAFKEGDKNCLEPFHINSLQVISEDQLLISLGRGGLVLYDKKKRKPVWIFSGPQDQFSLDNQIKPFLIHTPFFDTKTKKLLLFGNSFYGDFKTSNIVEYTLNPEKKSIEKMDFPAPVPFHSKLAGSVYETDGVYSVGYGEKNIDWDFIEFFEKKPTFKIGFRPRDTSFGSYRADRD
jgi:hypothetical protein